MNDYEIQTQIKQIKLKKAIASIIVLIGILLIIFTFFRWDGSQIGYFIIGAGFVFLSILYIESKDKELKQLITDNITAEILPKVFTLYEYDPNTRINTKYIKTLNIPLDYEDATSTNILHVDDDSLVFDYLETRLTYETTTTDANNHTTTETHQVFGGQVFVIHKEESFIGNVIIEPRIHFLRKSIKGDFGDSFKASGSEETIEEILTDEVMDWLLKQKYPTYISIHEGGKVVVAFDNQKSIFSLKGVDDLDLLRQKYKGQLVHIKNIVQELQELF